MDNTKTAPDQDNFETEEEYFKACREHRKGMDTKTAEEKHTPGPWMIDENAQIIAGKSVLGRIYSGDIFPNEDLPECTANGYLIAAAPEIAAERDRLKEEISPLKKRIEELEAASKEILRFKKSLDYVVEKEFQYAPNCLSALNKLEQLLNPSTNGK